MTLNSSSCNLFITLAGSPNSGKTTLFNYLSGKNYKTVNYPGSTVDSALANLQRKFNLNALLLDSPGIISLNPESTDEEIAINSLYKHAKLGKPDLVIVTVDASQLSRHLYLVKQIVNANFNVVIALTMVDILNQKGLDIDENKLSKIIHCKVFKVDSRSGKGVQKLLNYVNNIKNKLKNNHLQSSKSSGTNTTEEVLRIYNEIEVIEEQTIFELNENKNIDLTEANKQLNLITNKSLKSKCNQIDARTAKIDKILLHKTWGLLFFFLIMAFTFTSIFWFAQPIMDFISFIFQVLSTEMLILVGNNWLGMFLANGIINGVGSVAVFIPQILILFLILGFLEDSGYLARGAMLIDRPLSKIGLNGKSFVPMLSGFACAIPAMMAARTIPNRRERMLTIFILPLLSCSARLPVYTLLLAFLFPGNKAWIAGLVLASIYLLSTISSVLVAAIINKLNNKIIKDEDNSSFILELPAYRRPKLKVVAINMWHSGKLYIQKAGPVILVLSIFIWFFTTFPNIDPQVNEKNITQEQVNRLKNSERLATSYAADLGKIIQPVMTPLGLDWRVGVSLIAAFAAREVFVSSMTLIFKVTDSHSSLMDSMIGAMRNAKIGNTEQKLFTPASIIGIIIFFMFALQCLATVAVSRKETGSWRIPILQLLIFSSLAYVLSFIAVNGLRILGMS
ncbi:MAG: ferrous iron transport protein B [Bacteroidetes bacterium]|nr:ferrous iron transport protein B [Bacteroidota bacterium]